MTLRLAVNEPYILISFLLALYNSNLVLALQTVNSRCKIIEKKILDMYCCLNQYNISYFTSITFLKVESTIPNMISVFGIGLMLAL